MLTEAKFAGSNIVALDEDSGKANYNNEWPWALGLQNDDFYTSCN